MSDIERLLNFVGITSFVEHFIDYKELALNNTVQDKMPLIEKLLGNNSSAVELSGKMLEISAAITIFDNDWENEALKIITTSKDSMITKDTQEKVKVLYQSVKIMEVKDVINTINFKKQGQQVKNNPKPINIKFTNSDVLDSDVMKIGKVAQSIMRPILESNTITLDELNLLQIEVYSKENLDWNYPLLRKVDFSKGISEQMKDQKGKNRYYKSPLTIHGEKYLFCSQWFERSRLHLMKWIHLHS